MALSFTERIKKATQDLMGTSTPAPKSNKRGTVKKCPYCGAIVQNFQGCCPSCGYAFEETDANSAVKALNEALEKERSKWFSKDESRVIDNFPIPLDKATLLNFITWLQPQSKHSNGSLGAAYHRKYVECIIKSKAIFPNDPLFQPFVSEYEEEKRLAEERERKQRRRKILFPILWISLGILIVGFIVFLIFKPKPVQKSVQRSSVAIEKALQTGNTSKAIEIFLQFEGGKGNPKYKLVEEGAAASIIKACLADDNLTDAIRVGNAANMEYGDNEEYKATPASMIYDYCISKGDFKTAKEVYHTAKCEFYYHGKYIKDVVTYLCENGKKDEAQKFLNTHKGDINKGYDELGSDAVEMIQTIIDSY